jgi:hypothetical protein
MRCTRAQINGGVIAIYKGTALFDAVAISDTEAFNVRYRQFGDARQAVAC